MSSSTRRTGRRWASLAVVAALVAGLSVVTGTVTPAPTANAATVAVGTISAQMANQQGVDNGTNGNCIRYSPVGTGAATTWVTNTAANLPNSAITAHGYSGSSCPTNLSTSTQSALGFRPSTVTSAEDGTAFLIGGMTHYNNPILANDQYYKGRAADRARRLHRNQHVDLQLDDERDPQHRRG